MKCEHYSLSRSQFGEPFSQDFLQVHLFVPQELDLVSAIFEQRGVDGQVLDQLHILHGVGQVLLFQVNHGLRVRCGVTCVLGVIDEADKGVGVTLGCSGRRLRAALVLRSHCAN